MLTGNLYITNDINMLKTAMLQSKIVFICEPDPQLVVETNGAVASILMPPYSATMAMLDNNMPAFGELYFQHLIQKEASHFIAVMLKALLLGNNITLYLSRDESELPYSAMLLDFIKNAYGVTTGTMNVPYQYDVNYNGVILTLLYSFDLMNVQDFFCLYPPIIAIPENILMKLIHDINPYVENKTSEEYMKYFYEYKERIKKNNNKFLINPIAFGR